MNPLFTNYASDALKVGKAYRIKSNVYRLGGPGDVITVLDIAEGGDAFVKYGKAGKHYTIMRYLTTSEGFPGVQELIVENWGSLDHTLMHVLHEFIAE